MSFLFFNIEINAQTLPYYINSRGDTITYVFPIPDSSLCIKDEVVIKFYDEALNLSELCYIQPAPKIDTTFGINSINDYKSQIMAEQFNPFDLIADTNLLNTFINYGADYFTRITAANPCTDTLSITRYGDVVKVNNYSWLKLNLNNDTSVINLCINIMYNFPDLIEIAEPNYCGELNATPNDTYYSTHQISLHSEFVNVEEAWNYETGKQNIKIGIIDNGVDCFQCDLGADYPFDNPKVVGGWNYFHDNFYFWTKSPHGTKVAGIIGGLTNGKVECGTTEMSIAGIAGGWLPNNYGCQIIGCKVTDSDTYGEEKVYVDMVIGAIIDSASDYVGEDEDLPIPASFAINILNCSWGYGDSLNVDYLLNLRKAINYAYEHGVSIVASRGNHASNINWYPANFANDWVTNVGSHNSSLPPRRLQFPIGEGIDLLAPGDYYSIYTTDFDQLDSEAFIYFSNTSAAAAHVSGAIALLRSYNETNAIEVTERQPEPEDYENILKAAAIDLVYEDDDKDAIEGYDEATGWGQLKIGEAFEMIEEQEYVLQHYTTDNVSYSEFSGDLFEINVYSEGTRDDVAPKPYMAQRREVTATFDLGNNWLHKDANGNGPDLFVWGRHGSREKEDEKTGGFSQSTLVFLTPYTEVTSGEKGLPPSIPGLYHNNSNILKLKTYQFKLFEYNKETKEYDFKTNLPTNDKLEMHFSVYGVKNTTSVNKSKNYLNFTIFPIPAKNEIMIQFYSKIGCKPKITIRDLIGNILYEFSDSYVTTGIYNKSIDVADLCNGTYLIQIDLCNKILRDKFIISK